MGADPSDSLELDLLSASLRADLSDIGAFIEGLAVKLEQALPGVAKIDRAKQGFRGPKLVTRIVLDAGTGERLELRRDGQRLQPLRARVSGGIVIKTEPVDIDAWIASLTTVIAAEAGRNEQTRQALERLLMG